jgi:hypothetical protein
LKYAIALLTKKSAVIASLCFFNRANSEGILKDLGHRYRNGKEIRKKCFEAIVAKVQIIMHG